MVNILNKMTWLIVPFGMSVLIALFLIAVCTLVAGAVFELWRELF